jgi:NADPH2:quinone reductase
MKAAVLKEFGIPVYGDFNKPIANASGIVVAVKAAAISQFDIAVASGNHYMKPDKLPSVAGKEGIGELPDGRLVYFTNPISPYGSMAEYTLISTDSVIEVPEGVEEATAAVLTNSGLAAWLPLSWRAKLRPGEIVMVLGATGVVGQLAVQSAKLQGASTVIAVGRDEVKLLKTKELGADFTINLTDRESLSKRILDFAPQGVDVIIDYLWGEPALEALRAAAVGARLVQIGTKSSDLLNISGALMRSKNLTVMGFASYHAKEERRKAYQEICLLAREGKLKLEFERIPLSDVKVAWDMQRAGEPKRVVVIP